jgi:hypothetical protein
MGVTMWIRCPKCLALADVPAERFQELALSLDCPADEQFDLESDAQLLDDVVLQISETTMEIVCDSPICLGRNFSVRLGDIIDIRV